MSSEPVGPKRSNGTPGRWGEYATDDGDVTDVGRRQQVAVAVWVLGWLGGPLPALVALLVTRPAPGTYRRLLVAASWFWSVAAASSVALVVVARDEPGWLAMGWAVLSATGLVVTAVAIRSALRSIG